MSSKLTLAERIFTARRRVKASQEDIASACDTNRQQVSKWERGKAVPDLLESIRLARYTRTPLDFFTEDLDIDLTDEDGPKSTWTEAVQVWRPRIDRRRPRHSVEILMKNGPFDSLLKAS